MSFSLTRFHSTCIFLTLLVFVIDLNIPLGVAGGVPYISVILITLWSPKHSPTLYYALICSGMVVLGYYFSPAGGETWKVLINRALAIFAIWVTAILILMWRNKIEEMEALNQRLHKEKEDIYIATIHSSQHIVNNLLNQLQYIKNTVETLPEFDQRNRKIFNSILEEGALLMEKLSSVEEINKDAIKQSVMPQSDTPPS